MEALLDEYMQQGKSYVGLPLSSDSNFDTELVQSSPSFTATRPGCWWFNCWAFTI